MAAGGTAARAVLVIGASGLLGGTLVRAFEIPAGGSCGGCGGVMVPAAHCRGSRRSETVAAAIADVDLVVDPVPHPGLTAERAVLREGGALIDVSMRPADAARRLRAEATSARGTVVVNGGRTPA